MVGSDTEATVMLNVVPGLNTGITAFNAGLSSINAQFQNITEAVDKTFGIVDSMIISTGVMVAQFGMGAANAFGEFEQGMQIVKAVSQQSGQSMAYLKQEAQDFAVQYRTGIDSITEGLQTLGRAGLNSAQEQTEVLEQGLQTAKLEGRELNGVLEEIIQNTTLLGADTKSDQFGEQAEYLNNLLVGTSLSSPIDTHDISETLKYSGGMVAAAGGTIATDEGYANEQGREIVEDYMGAVAAFGQKGVKGSIAGTALRAFFNKPATQDKSVVEALESIGLAPEDLWNDEETMKPVSEQIELIQTQMNAKNVSKMDQMQLWSKIVGGKMGQQMMKLDAQDIREMTTDIKEAGSAKELSEQTFNTYNQQMNKFSEEGQRAFREFGRHIVTAVKPALEVLTKLMDLLSNPIVSFGGFIAFMTIMSHAMQAVMRIAGRFKTEVGSLLGGGGTSSLAPSKYKGLLLEGKSIPTKWDGMKFSEKKELPESKYKGMDVVPKGMAQEKAATKKKGQIGETKKTKQDFFNTVKQNISDISQKINELISTMEEKFNSFDVNVDVNLDDVQKSIQNIGNVATNTIQSISKRADAASKKIKEDIQEIQTSLIQTNEIQSNVMAPGTGQPINNSQITKEQLGKTYTKEGLKELLLDMGHDESEFNNFNKIKKDKLIDMVYGHYNPDISQIFNGGAAGLDSEIIRVLQNDPYFKDILSKNGLDYKGHYGENENYRANKKEFGGGGMFPHALTPEELALATTFMPSTALEDIIFLQDMRRAFPEYADGWRKDKETGGWYNDAFDNRNKNDKDLVSEEDAKAQLDPFFEDAKAKQQGINLINAYFEQLKLIQDEAFAEARAKNAVFSSNIPGVMPKDAMDYLENREKPNIHTRDDLLRVIEEARQKHGLETVGFSNAVPGVGVTPDMIDKYYVEPENPQNYSTNYYEYLNERQRRGTETLGFSTGVPGVGIPQEVLDEYSHTKTWSQRLRDNQYGGRTGKALSWLGDKAGKVGDKFDGLAKTMGSQATSGIGKAIDLLGGKFNVAIMAATAAMEVYNYMFGQWQKQSQEHQTKLSEAQDKMSEAEGNIREEYLKNNPNATQADADKAVEDAYLAIEDNNYDMSALDENTQALYVATYQVQRASELLEGDAMDGNFGINGLSSNFSDSWGNILNILTGNQGKSIIMDDGSWSPYGDYNIHQGAITENQGNAVLTSSQSSDDYFYSKENAAIFAADVWQAIDEGRDKYDYKKGRITDYAGHDGFVGLDNFFGSDSAHFKEVTQSIFRGQGTYGGSGYDTMAGMLARNFQQESQQHQLQMFLKNNQKEAQKLAKGIRKFEKANKGRNPLSFFTDKKGNRIPQQKALKNLEVKDKDLVKYLRSLSIKTGMSAQQLLMASQLQQMQDLNQVMTEQLQPQVIGLAQNAYQQLSAQQNIGGNTSNTSSGAWSTYSAAAAIASKLNVLVEQALDTEMQQDYIANGGDNPEYIDNPQKMKADMVKAFNTPESQRTQEQRNLVNNYGKKWFESYYLSGWESGHPNASQADKDKALANFDKTMSQYDNFGKLIADTRKGANDYYTKALVAAYDASKLGEDGDSPSGGSGGGGGDGGSDKGSDKDTGTKKERVDLVLCNKKEIPKLNVNLFKKAPQFTVLNKNFKLRDIKINTQDKPKAVLDSLKNAIIDTQKRMDPKIIQDEEAEYDPVAATDGNKTPSGSTSTTTDD